MSEPPPIPNLEHSGDTPPFSEDDQTQPTEEILNALRQINPQVLGVQNGGDLSTVKQQPTPTPQSEWDQLRAQLREKPYDADAWLRLVDLAEDSQDIEKIKATYDALLEAYPNTVCRSLVCTSEPCLTSYSVISPDRVH